MKRQISIKAFLLILLTSSTVSCDLELPELKGNDKIRATFEVASRNTKSDVSVGCGLLMKDSFNISGTGDIDMVVIEEDQQDAFQIISSTKGSVITTLNLSYLLIDAYLDEDIAGLDSHYISDGYVHRTESGKYSDIESLSSGEPYYWVNGVKLHFWGHWMCDPQEIAGDDYDFSIQRPRYSVSDDYTHFYIKGYLNGKSESGDNDAECQKDAIVSYNSHKYNEKGSDAINILAYHALSAIRFDITNLPADISVSEVSLVGLYAGGDCDVESSDGGLVFNWAPSLTVASYSQKYSADDITSSQDPDEINGYQRVVRKDSGKIFFIVPQVLPSDAKIGVKFLLSDGVTEVYKEIAIGTYDGSSIRWKPGKIYTYRFSLSSSLDEYYLETDIDESEVESVGGQSHFNIVSYKKAPGNVDDVPVEWTITGYSRDGITYTDAPVDMLGNVTVDGDPEISGMGGNAGETLSFLVNQNSECEAVGNADGTHMLALRSAPQRGTLDAPYDLSTHTPEGETCLMSSANCYVVNAPGYYKIPMVYGNAVKDGEDNKPAYIYGKDREHYLKVFKNHLNNDIVAPWIKDNGIEITSAKLVWQDGKDIVMPESVNLDGDYIGFQVSSTDIQQGNILIAAYSGDVIVWSWHIWVTDYVLGTNLCRTLVGGVSYDFIPYNLGWFDGGQGLSNPQRTLYVRIQQEESGKELILKIIQRERMLSSEFGSSTYFQWGRKDPIIAFDVKSHRNKTTYPSDVRSISRLNVQLGTAIMNPCVDYHGERSMWLSDVYYNLWNTCTIGPGTMDYHTTKTIYDPSPAGYCVPPQKAFSNFVAANAVPYSNYLFYVKCEDGKMLTLQPTGSRSGTTGDVYNTSTIYSWASNHSSEFNYACSLRYTNGKWYPLGQNYTACGFPVRPIKDN